jgi:adenine-specific DNA-methyltransferase
MNFKEQETPQKLRGGYYTPLPIAELLSRWVLSHGATAILEPSCGDGVFLRALYTQIAASVNAPQISLEAVEIVAEEAAKSEQVCAQLREIGVNARVIQHDIFSWLDNGRAGRQWDAILGNPPYIRYQYFEKDQRELAEQLFKRARIHFSKRTNAWASLVLACVMHLKPGGSLALVLPAELLHIQHAGSLRRLLEQEMETITLINIREMVFPDVLQGVVLLLARKKHAQNSLPLACHKSHQYAQDSQPTATPDQQARISLFDLDSLASLSTLALDQLAAQTQQSISDTHGEWMLGLLSDEEASLLKRLRVHQAVQPFEAIADVDIGVVTGANDFFVVNRETLERFELASIASPMLAKSDLIKGITYTQRDHETNREAGKAVFFLQFPVQQLANLPALMAAYITSGEARQLHERYKCRIREPWYIVPYIWTSEVALLKRCHLYPRLVVNELGAHSTDTAYRVRLHANTAGRARDLAFSFLNSLTFLCAELGGRHYGGGVLELVPSEIEKLLIPLQPVTEHIFAQIDAMIRQRATLDELLAITDPLILGQGLGLTEQEIQIIRAAHRRLLKRRLRINEASSFY